VSKTPGCTQHLNFYAMNGRNHGKKSYLVDLPGYGFAAAPKKNRTEWKATMDDYLIHRDIGVLRCVLFFAFL
jgi:GTP-binding protein